MWFKIIIVCIISQDIILDQQDILDFYSLLCGTSMRKLEPTLSSSVDHDVTVDEDAEENPVEIEYECQLQLNQQQPLEGMQAI